MEILIPTAMVINQGLPLLGKYVLCSMYSILHILCIMYSMHSLFLVGIGPLIETDVGINLMSGPLLFISHCYLRLPPCFKIQN